MCCSIGSGPTMCGYGKMEVYMYAISIAVISCSFGIDK